MTDIASQPSAMDAIGDAYWEEALRLNPTAATVYGDERYNHLLPDPSAAGRRAEIDAVRRASDAADALPDADLSNEDRITRAIFAVLAELAEEDEALHAYEVREVDQIYGPQTVLPQVATFQRADTPELLEAWLERLRAYGPHIDAHIEVLHEGRASGRTAARIVAERTIDQVRRLVDTPLDQAVIPGLSKVATDEDRERVREVVRDVVYPADRRYLEALSGEYLAATRDEPGIVSAPGGEGLYRHFIRRWTTLDLDPRDVHQVGLDEYAHIDEERRAIARGAGFGDDVDGYRRSLLADPANHAPTVEALLEHVTQAIDRAGAVAPQVFGRLPRASCIVKAVEPFKEKDAPPAYYYPPTIDGSRPGTYYINTVDLDGLALHKLAAYTFHEAIPGHHFQISLEMEHPQLGVFRRLGTRAVDRRVCRGLGAVRGAAGRRAGPLPGRRRSGSGCSTHRRGGRRGSSWTPGLHGLGWTRQQSVDWLLTAGLTPTDAAIETDRYIAWPGQALSYMTGMREIRRLRQGARGARRRPVRHQGVPRRAHRPRLAAAGHAHDGAAALGPPEGLIVARRHRPASRAVGPGRPMRSPSAEADRVPARRVVRHDDRASGGPHPRSLRPRFRQHVRAHGRAHGAGDRRRPPRRRTEPTSRSRSRARPSPGGTAPRRPSFESARDHRPAHDLDRGRPGGLRRDRERTRADEPQPEQVRVRAEDGVAQDPGRPAGRPDAQPRVAQRVVDAPAEGVPERDAEPRRGVDRAAPAVGEPDPVELREASRRSGAPAASNVAGRCVVRGLDRVAGVVDRVVAAPQDPVVGRLPEVVELVARVGHALAAGPADRVAAGRRSAARS